MFESGPLAAVLDVASRGVLALTGALTPFAGTAAAAAAIVLLTFAIRALLIPVGVSTVRAAFARARLAPELEKLRSVHAKDPRLLQQKQLELYRERGVSPFAGMLPLLLQAPVLSLVYALFLHDRIAGRTNALLSHSLFGVPLGQGFTAALHGSSHAALVIGGVLAVLALVVAVQRRVLMASAPPQPAGASGPAAGAARALSYLSFITVAFAFFVPLAAVLYLATTTAWTTVERAVITARVRRAEAGSSGPDAAPAPSVVRSATAR